jgi:hypothetical protein
MQLENIFVHHVFFYLKDHGAANVHSLVEGLRKLSAASTIKKFHIGVPADTYRDVVERSYGVSWLVFFDSAADQESYQTDPIHLDFIKECSHLWNRVVVYDSVPPSPSVPARAGPKGEFL